MSKSTISTFKLFELFPDEETAREYLEGRLWPSGAICPECKSGERITKRTGGFYRCNACKLDFTVRTATIFERSHIPLHKWVYAMYLLVTARKGISSMQLAKEIGVTQKSAWFMLHRLREACGSDDNLDKLRGVIEIDECFVGGKEKNKHESKKLHAGRGSVGKIAVLGMRERRGRTRAKVTPVRSLDAIHGEIHALGELLGEETEAERVASERQKPRTELDELLDRVREYKADPAGKNLSALAYDCWRMFEDLATRYKEESAMRDRYKRQSNGWMNKAFEIDEIKATLLDAVNDALAFLDRPDITTYEWYKLAPDHVAKFRRAIAKAEVSK